MGRNGKVQLMVHFWCFGQKRAKKSTQIDSGRRLAIKWQKKNVNRVFCVVYAASQRRFFCIFDNNLTYLSFGAGHLASVKGEIDLTQPSIL